MLCCRRDAYEGPGIRGLRMHLVPEVGDQYEEFYKLENFGVEVSIRIASDRLMPTLKMRCQ